jgi:diaminohydroxyphosphoribosylaminopyrimidine deaminase/5-amino-6-(5-phosphoribosylamino)uracil reductase
VFDRRLRTPPDARLFSTLAAGPVIILTSSDAQRQQPDRARALERAGATLIAPDAHTVAAGLRALVPLDIQSVVLEGGAAMHQAAWDEGVVDYVHLYVAPTLLGSQGVAFLDGRSFSPTFLEASTVTPLGPDVLFEGYVHRPH